VRDLFGTTARPDEAELVEAFDRDGIVRIGNFLPPEAAQALHSHLRGRGEWLQIFNSGDKLFELNRHAVAALDDAKKADLDTAIYAGARTGFQYRFETIRVPDDEQERAAEGGPLAELAQWLSTGETRAFLRRVTGSADIRFADAQATAYSPGDFLTGHDDAFEGKNRRAAYVLSLTPTWRLEWGGLLVMHGEGDEPSRAYPPEMNVLTLFRVGQMHSVSEVTRAAAYRRYSVTGWLRA
jgi:Rps23 Pro-64 3,4-dihydroxylase Tpa1-like proline 4-hydroxylase